MDFMIASMLTIDGLTNGAVYALLGMTIVLVFTVTRILFIAQGEFVVFGALTFAQLSAGQVPSVIGLLVVLLAAAIVQEIFLTMKQPARRTKFVANLGRLCALPTASLVIAWGAHHAALPLVGNAVVTIMLIAPMGMLLYRLVYRSISHASVLTLLIVSVGVHFALLGLGLTFFGPEGYRAPMFVSASWTLSGIYVSGQAVLVIAITIALIGLLFWFFSGTFRGMALRATAVNEKGARIVGISTAAAGETSLTMAAAIGALSGLLIGSTTTMYYDTGFLIGLKGFIAAVFAGLASFPAALVGAMFVGLIESFGSFWSSAFKETIVFGAVIPILLWRSILHGTAEE